MWCYVIIILHNTTIYCVKDKFMWTDRTEILVGKNGIKKLSKSHVAVVGIGGVGGYACSMLARAGVGKLTIVDFDRVDESNINRQIVADTTTVGRLKTDVMKEFVAKINPNCIVNVVSERFCEENLSKINLKDCDFVVDAIDSVKDKLDLICFCIENEIKIVSAMGSGNRICIPEFKVMDIYKTNNDGLAKVMRKKLRERGIKSLKVVACETKPQDIEERIVGSISYFPAMCGCVISAYVIENLLK